MPELPEVENVRRQLARWCVGRAVVRVEVHDPAVVRSRLSTRPRDALDGGAEALTEALQDGVLAPPTRYGKRLGWPLATRGLLVHLGMTGRWTCGEPATRATRLTLTLDTGEVVRFHDSRRFGCLVLCERDALEERLRDGLGPDPTVDALSAQVLRERLRGRRAVKVALLDQAVLAGLGNIHAAEALLRSGIHPTTRCDALEEGDLARLSIAILAQLADTIEELGDQPVHYITDGGPNPFSVYGREGMPCRVCEEPVEAIMLGGRSTFFCGQCQPLRPQG